MKDEIENRICDFDIYLKQTMDLLKDSFKWKVMAEECDKEEMKEKYMNV